jgi:hypothetical protein
MKKRFLFFAVVAVLLLGIGYSASAVPEKGDKKSGILSTGLNDQTGVAVTIYNVNLGLVKDQREIKLKGGIGELRFMDVASQIIPTSVHIKSLIDPDSLQVLEQNYEYDLLNPQKLLDKYVGKDVKPLFRERGDCYSYTPLKQRRADIQDRRRDNFWSSREDHIPGSSGKPYIETNPCMAY